MTAPRSGGRRKLEADPAVRARLLAAAAAVLREEGLPALSVARVLDRAGLGTRAFYRHFGSKDELVSAMFLEMARAEVSRLKERMAPCPDPIQAVAAWIDARLDLAFRSDIRSELQQLSVEAQHQMLAAPDLVAPAYRAILRPLVDELARGHDLGFFPGIEPEVDALSIQGVVWSNTEQYWAKTDLDIPDVRARIQEFCLRGLGVAPDTLARLIRDT
jgi:AcrR family transcriptional regulator